MFKKDANIIRLSADDKRPPRYNIERRSAISEEIVKQTKMAVVLNSAVTNKDGSTKFAIVINGANDVPFKNPNIASMPNRDISMFLLCFVLAIAMIKTNEIKAGIIGALKKMPVSIDAYAPSAHDASVAPTDKYTLERCDWTAFGICDVENKASMEKGVPMFMPNMFADEDGDELA